jgi:predicted homoserine dehydrogenase-like protein
MYDAADLVYTGSDGDEPAATTELFEFAKSMGMEVLVAGKGKNNKLKVGANPDTYTKSAASYIFFINGPIVISTSTFSNTMCFFANKVSNEIAYNASAEKKVDILVSSDFKEIIHSDKVEVIVDATGVPEDITNTSHCHSWNRRNLSNHPKTHLTCTNYPNFDRCGVDTYFYDVILKVI